MVAILHSQDILVHAQIQIVLRRRKVTPVMIIEPEVVAVVTVDTVAVVLLIMACDYI